MAEAVFGLGVARFLSAPGFPVLLLLYLFLGFLEARIGFFEGSGEVRVDYFLGLPSADFPDLRCRCRGSVPTDTRLDHLDHLRAGRDRLGCGLELDHLSDL